MQADVVLVAAERRLIDPAEQVSCWSIPASLPARRPGIGAEARAMLASAGPRLIVADDLPN